jgi:hypothetical protein
MRKRKPVMGIVYKFHPSDYAILEQLYRFPPLPIFSHLFLSPLASSPTTYHARTLLLEPDKVGGSQAPKLVRVWSRLCDKRPSCSCPSPVLCMGGSASLAGGEKKRNLICLLRLQVPDCIPLPSPEQKLLFPNQE